MENQGIARENITVREVVYIVKKGVDQEQSPEAHHTSNYADPI